MSDPTCPPLQPWDDHNQRLLANVRPTPWSPPTPARRYNLVVIGGGTAGLVAAAGAAGLGAKVALVEKHHLGGDCLNTGCVPSKAILRAARAAHAVRDAHQFGIHLPAAPRVDFGAVMERVRRLRADLSPHDSARRFADLGVDVFLGAGRFVGRDTVQVDDHRLRFSRAVIATGARAVAPDVPGLDQVPYLTHETLFSLTTLPPRLGILGAGPIGTEMAQAFARLGSAVTLIESAPRVLPRDDPDAAALVGAALERDHVRLFLDAKPLAVEPANPGIRLRLSSRGQPQDIVVDQLLVAAGRCPNIDGLGLESVGIARDSRGIKVDEHLRTSHPRVYACGDVCSPYAFTHAADFFARTVLQNALFHGRARWTSLIIPWTTYTSPEVAHVGLGPEALAHAGPAFDTFTQELARVDRAVLDGETAGFIRVHVRKGTDRLLGATIVAEHAGEMIGELALAMKAGLGLRTLASTIHPYPTQAEGIRKLGDLYNRTRLTPGVRRLMQRWFRWTA